MSLRCALRRSSSSLTVAAVVLLLSGPCLAGYEFSISVSDTDPHVNTSSASGTYRNLYLWMVCTDEGLSAFEAGATGSLSISGFNPLNGVMNAGTSTDLMLAVPGCPSDSFLLGYWVVWDAGGTLCLSPTSTNEIIGGVNCATEPLLREDPEVTGFSSSGTPPCSVGANGCGEFFLEESGGGSIGTEWEP